MALPSNVPVALKELSLLSDEIWWLAGDKSVDMNWYTKRASLAAIYGATGMFLGVLSLGFGFVVWVGTDLWNRNLHDQGLLKGLSGDVEVLGEQTRGCPQARVGSWWYGGLCQLYGRKCHQLVEIKELVEVEGTADDEA